MAGRYGYHHTRIRLANLQHQVIGRQPLAHHFFPMLGPQGRLEQGHRIARQQSQAERKQGRLGIAQRIDLAGQHRRRLEEQSLDCPALPVNLGHAHRGHLLRRQVRQDMHFCIAIPRRLVQGHRDATNLHNRALLAAQPQALLVDPARLTTALRFPLAQQRALDIAVLAQHKAAAAGEKGCQEPQGAEVTVRHPHLAGADQRCDGVQQGPFLGVPVFGQQHVGNRHVFLVQHHEGQTRQGGGPGPAQFAQAVLCGGEVVAVQELDTVAGQQRGQRSSQGVDDRCDAPGGITDQ